MTKPVIAEIRPAARIVGSVLLHAVSNRVTGRRTVRHWRRTVIVARAIGGCSYRSAYDCARDESSDDRGTPSTASPLYSLGGIRDGIGEHKRLAERRRTGYAGERRDAAHQHG